MNCCLTYDFICVVLNSNFNFTNNDNDDDDDDDDVWCCCRLKQGECDVIDNDVMDAAACFTLADGRSAAESRDLATFDPLQSTLAHRFRSYAPGGGYTCVTLLSPDRDELLQEPEMLIAPGSAADCENLTTSRDAAHRCMEPLLQTGSRKPPATSSEHARRCVNADAVCSTCIAKHRHLQSQHAQRQYNMAADVTGSGSWTASCACALFVVVWTRRLFFAKNQAIINL